MTKMVNIKSISIASKMTEPSLLWCLDCYKALPNFD